MMFEEVIPLTFDDYKRLDELYQEIKEVCKKCKLWDELKHFVLSEGNKIDRRVKKRANGRMAWEYYMLRLLRVIKEYIEAGEIDRKKYEELKGNRTDEEAIKDLTIAIFKLMEKGGIIDHPAGAFI
uniref:Uncharacterized protein n=1 Tax=Candidatus Methanophagaceae archaeon ANME-1 ERB6 TaxID=2759912 RepID=A0A7G9YZT8_9EURY|nr:hypothetical protein GZ19C7_24 [uncultured archaeon GZfos19C7]QNO53522.1 hypothetical protein FLCOADKM_00012 [Methanosarcinales archaeon ANME-1 ERB6]